jgi:hypothetical protein
VAIDREKYDYIPILGDNVVVQMDKGTQLARPNKVCPIMEPIVRKCLLRHPSWMFVSNNFCRRGAAYDKSGATYTVCTMLQVYEKGEYLGWIDSEAYGGPRIRISNDRIVKERRRGEAVVTKDMAKAIKIIDKYFIPKSTHENLMETVATLKNFISQQHVVDRGNYSTLVMELGKAVTRKYAAEGWDTLDADLSPYGLAKYQVDNASKLTDAFNTSLMMFNSATGSYVRLSGGLCTLRTERPLNPATTTTLTIDELTDWQKLGISKLKLVADKTVLPGVGYRLSENAVFLLRDPDEPTE